MDKDKLSRSESKTSKASKVLKITKKKEIPKKLPPEFALTPSTSHTQYLRKERHQDNFERITTEEYLGFSETITGTSESFHCLHPGGKKYTARGQLKRNLQKQLDPIPTDAKWTEECPPAYTWELAKVMENIVLDSTAHQQYDRLVAHVDEFAETASKGYKIHILDSLCTVLDFLMEIKQKVPSFRPGLTLLMKNMDKPISLNLASDVITHFDQLRNYLGFLVYLLMRVEDDELFSHISKGMLYQLSAPDSLRGHGAVQVRHVLAAGSSVVLESAVRMLAVADPFRFPTFLEICLLIACDDADICMQMMYEKILENIFGRFNPYFPHKRLPQYEINPADPQDPNIKLGESSVNMTTTLSLLLVLVQTTNKYLDENPSCRHSLPCPDLYSQRCFAWAYRYECRARGHSHERITMTIIIQILLKCYGKRLEAFGSFLMADVMSLSVRTELPLRNDWTGTVNFNTHQADVQFKKLLILLSVEFIKTFPYNNCMVESRHWVLGLMYLLDPGLCYLRARWTQSLFAELRKTALQSLVCTIPIMPRHLTKVYGMIRRIMWYIEWYSESPYELPVLYWCMRLLQVTTYPRNTKERKDSIVDLFDTHGVIILMHLNYTLLAQKTPPVEKSQLILALSLRMLSSAVEFQQTVACCVYPHIKWPASVNSIAAKMLDVVIYSLEKHFIINDKWLISLMNFIWESIVWNDNHRAIFIANNGIYTLLDLITMVSPPAQCITLALVCDVARAGDAIGQLVTWRAKISASESRCKLVKRGATIATLLAAIFRDECQEIGVPLNENGIIEDLEKPIMSSEMKQAMKNHNMNGCMVADDIAGSRMSKAYALLQMLSEDLEAKINLADEAYHLYKNVELTPEDETILVLCSHYLTLKINEVWLENSYCVQPVAYDAVILKEFLLVVKGWAKKVKRQQEDVIEKERKKELDDENSLYAFLARVRLNIALDALKEVKCVASSADRECIAHTLLFEAVKAHHRRSLSTKAMKTPILKTYYPNFDDQNISGQYVKVYSILRKDAVKRREDYPPSS